MRKLIIRPEMSDFKEDTKIDFTEGFEIIRKKFFGLKSITALPRKTFEYASIQTCVLQLEKGFKGDTNFIVYDTIKNENQLKLIK